MEDANGNKVVLTPVIFPKLKYISKFPVLACTSLLLARSKKTLIFLNVKSKV